MIHTIKFALFGFILIYSHSVFACGSAANWMDTFEGIKVGNNWRDNMNQREALTMLHACGTDKRLNKDLQIRMAKVLGDAMSNKFEIHRLPASNADIRSTVEKYSSLVAYEGLVESIYRRYGCLQNIRNSEEDQDTLVDTFIYDYFGEANCPGHKERDIEIIANDSATLHVAPEGKVVASLEKGTLLRLLGSTGNWYRVLNPTNAGRYDFSIAYIHKSSIDAAEP